MILATDFLSVMSFWLPNEVLTSSSHLRGSATDFLLAMDSDLEQSPYIVGDGFLISNEFFWLPNEALIRAVTLESRRRISYQQWILT